MPWAADHWRALEACYELPPGWCIVTDARITRRKYFHFIVAPDRTIKYRSRLLWECIEWLAEEEISTAALIDGDAALTGPRLSVTLTVEK